MRIVMLLLFATCLAEYSCNVAHECAADQISRSIALTLVLFLSSVDQCNWSMMLSLVLFLLDVWSINTLENLSHNNENAECAADQMSGSIVLILVLFLSSVDQRNWSMMLSLVLFLLDVQSINASENLSHDDANAECTADQISRSITLTLVLFLSSVDQHNWSMMLSLVLFLLDAWSINALENLLHNNANAECAVDQMSGSIALTLVLFLACMVKYCAADQCNCSILLSLALFLLAVWSHKFLLERFYPKLSLSFYQHAQSMAALFKLFFIEAMKSTCNANIKF